MPLEPPELIDDGSNGAWLVWKPASVPHTTKMAMTKSITYSIEMRMPPCYDWNILVENLDTTKYKITELLPDKNYVFRVRCYNEFGGGEATLPVTLRRATNGKEIRFINNILFELICQDGEKINIICCYMYESMFIKKRRLFQYVLNSVLIRESVNW